MLKIIFLDRDGVLNRFPGRGRYLTRMKDLAMVPGSAEAVGELTRAGYEVHVVSNQGCISRGLITMEKLDSITRRIRSAVERRGGKVRKFHYCVHQKADRCECKKPKTLLFRRALGGRKPDRRPFMIGDSIEDIQAGRRAGCRPVLVLSGRLKRRDVDALRPRPEAVFRDLKEAVRWILKKR